MSSERDPYPMMSTEAKDLEASVQGESSKTKKWSSMSTESDVDTSRAEAEQEEASSSLVGKKKKGQDDDDIYARADEEDEADKEDPVLDIPLEELRGTPMDRFKGSTKRTLLKIYKRLYGDKHHPPKCSEP